MPGIKKDARLEKVDKWRLMIRDLKTRCLIMHSASCSGHIEHTTQIFGTTTAKWFVVHSGMRGSELQGQKPDHLPTRLMRTRRQKKCNIPKVLLPRRIFRTIAHDDSGHDDGKSATRTTDNSDSIPENTDSAAQQ